jgi:hypothetical protein
MWFLGVNIPVGSTILNAYLQFQVDAAAAEGAATDLHRRHSRRSSTSRCDSVAASIFFD